MKVTRFPSNGTIIVPLRDDPVISDPVQAIGNKGNGTVRDERDVFASLHLTHVRAQAHTTSNPT